jgi:hypothetical protein
MCPTVVFRPNCKGSAYLTHTPLRKAPAFHPRAIQASTYLPPLVLTGFEVFNQPLLPGTAGSPLSKSITKTTRLEIPSRFSVLSFDFAALSYRSSRRYRYRFMLEGSDETWRPASTERRATYTNLDAGRYRWRGSAANNDGGWNETGVTLDLVVVPPWWRTNWFRGLAAFLLVSVSTTTGWALSAHRSRDRLRKADRTLAAARERARAESAIRETETA